jgi:hypothetical protein
VSEGWNGVQQALDLTSDLVDKIIVEVEQVEEHGVSWLVHHVDYKKAEVLNVF